MINYELWYFIEGKDLISNVTISKDEKVAELKRGIYRDFPPGYWGDVGAAELTLLKVVTVPLNCSNQHSR